MLDAAFDSGPAFTAPFFGQKPPSTLPGASPLERDFAFGKTTTREVPPPDNNPAPFSLTAADPQEDAAPLL